MKIPVFTGHRSAAASMPWSSIAAASALLCGGMLGLTAVLAATFDLFGPPPPTDPSASTDQPADPAAALLQLFKEEVTNRGAFELANGQFGTKEGESAGNVL